MDINIPDTVMFTTVNPSSPQPWKWYCFAHAVLRALEGEDIRVELAYEPMTCNDCTHFGKPNHHDLSSLRRES